MIHNTKERQSCRLCLLEVGLLHISASSTPKFIQYLKAKANMPSAQELIKYMMTSLNDSADEGKS